jgi:16S rRNA (guanine527-N7)-methyltransferase
VFGSRLETAERYVDLLSTAGIDRGLLGPREIPRLWERHVLNCAVLTDLVPPGASVADIGSGAGLPGLVAAIRRPDLTVTLVEPLLRRTTFLEEVVAELGLGNVVVHRGRAQDLPAPVGFDVVTSRAVAPLDRLLEWCLPLVSAGGAVLAIKGRSAQAEIDALGLPAAAGDLVSVVELTAPELVVPTTVVRVDSRLARHVRLTRSRGGTQRRPGSSHRPRRSG